MPDVRRALVRSSLPRARLQTTSGVRASERGRPGAILSHAREKQDHLQRRQIETAKLAATHCGDLADTALDTATRDKARRYQEFWLGVAAKREAELRGGKPQPLAVKP